MDIKIRQAEPKDFNDLYEVYSRPLVIEGTLQIPFPSEETWKNRLAETPKAAHVLVCEVDSKVLGNIGLYAETRPRRNHVAHIGMAVHDDWQGKGLGSALLKAALDLADNWLNLKRIELTVFVDNESAIKLYQNNGFEIEGTLKQFAFTNGAYKDAYTMARIKD